MSETVPVSTASPAPSRARRVLSALNLVALSLVVSFLALLIFAASSPMVRESLSARLSEHKVASVAAVVTILVIALAGPLTILVVCHRRGWLRWPQLTALWGAALGTMVYLAWDDASIHRPLTMEELSPALPGDEVSHQIFLRYAKNSPAALAVQPLKLNVGLSTNDIMAKPEKWEKFLRENRAGIEAEWAKLAPVRAWWDELAAQPRIGDLIPTSASAPILAFQPPRQYSQVAVAIASLQALDGRGDEAMATVTRLYTVARKMEPNARTLVRTMIAKVIQRMAMQTAGFVLDHAKVSPAAQAAFAAELSAAAGGPAGARRIILIEYAFFQPVFTDFIRHDESAGLIEEGPERIFQKALRSFGALLVNPNATQNIVGDRYYAMAALAEQRRFGELEAKKDPINRDFMDGYSIKNLGGRIFADLAMPAVSKVVKTYWDIEDQRAAMLARLKA